MSERWAILRVLGFRFLLNVNFSLTSGPWSQWEIFWLILVVNGHSKDYSVRAFRRCRVGPSHRLHLKGCVWCNQELVLILRCGANAAVNKRNMSASTVELKRPEDGLSAGDALDETLCNLLSE